tara:strand:+ start:117 stop:449 length:333 start_codon:yes stop_codon:yes gene_type:complete
MALMKITALDGSENIVDVDIPLVLADNAVNAVDIKITGGTQDLTIELNDDFASDAEATAAVNSMLIAKVEEAVNDPYHIPVLSEILDPATWDRKNMAAQTAYLIAEYTIA